MADHLLRHTAQHPVLEASIAVATQHDEIGVQRPGSSDDRLCGSTHEGMHFCGDTAQLL